MFLRFIGQRFYNGDTGGDGGGSEQGEEFDPDAWYDALPDELKNNAEKFREFHTGKVKSALEAERAERKKIAKELKELASKPVDASQWEAKIAELNSKATEAETKARFVEEATANGVAPGRILKAYAAARYDKLIDEAGAIDWDTLKSEHDYFFAAPAADKPAPKGGGGYGVDKKPAPKATMNQLIRRQAGRG